MNFNIDSFKFTDSVQHNNFKIMSSADAIAGANLLWTLMGGVLVMFMQAGFALLESGSVRFKNYQNILLKNLMDACIGGLVWWAIGFAFAYGNPA